MNTLSTQIDIHSSLQQLRTYIEYEQLKGYDPYDALNSPFLKFFSFSSKFLSIAFIQSLKKSPVNLRPIFGIRKDYNPKGIGLFLWGYAKLYKAHKSPEYLETTQHLIELLDNLKSTSYSGNCWGYNFDWQSRAFYVPRFTPTIVNSAFIGHALIDTYEHTGIQKALDMAVSIRDFILRDLNRTQENGRFCFSYTPLDHTAVHNANLLGASLLIRLYKYTKDNELRDKALSSLGYSMRRQNEDGSWYYADTEFQRWIDSFHTGFNLQSILYFLEEGFSAQYRPAFEKGVEFYKKNFFLPDGTPKYYHNKTYPIDIHSPAQAVVFFSKMGKPYRDIAEKILSWMINNFQDLQGFFYFQKTKYYTNKIPYMRWSQAWAFHALTEYLLANHKSSGA